MTTFEQEQLRQLKRINAQLNPGPALLKLLALIFGVLIVLAALACLMNSQRSDVGTAQRSARHRILYGGCPQPLTLTQVIDLRSQSK